MKGKAGINFPAVFLRCACLLLTGLFAVYPCFAQTGKKIDVNHDGKPDFILHHPSTNTFEVDCSVGKQHFKKTIRFFEDYDQHLANMSYNTKNGLLWFSIRFAPKYLDQDTLWFRFDKNKKDWALQKVTSYRFNTMDPALISSTCTFVLKKKLWLLRDNYQLVQELMENRKNRISKKCIEKQEH
ncbi:hypothetical protein [Pedobacter nutrimenti]|jgi:hypothetical protein|uniref:VCBS repeat protein n=1 Tax=Pedobacter nutrimenti TaxID=1241337 RepID=A0A318UFB4_9SPHI|nr:hypothetical protein [Pedobacter nutrimenti]PYF74793.1 hypothetical protein B0O44_103239 [Pedobacter nutrimenti]